MILSMEDKHYCPQHGYPLPCFKCGYDRLEISTLEQIICDGMCGKQKECGFRDRNEYCQFTRNTTSAIRRHVVTNKLKGSGLL